MGVRYKEFDSIPEMVQFARAAGLWIHPMRDRMFTAAQLPAELFASPHAEDPRHIRLCALSSWVAIAIVHLCDQLEQLANDQDADTEIEEAAEAVHEMFFTQLEAIVAVLRQGRAYRDGSLP